MIWLFMVMLAPAAGMMLFSPGGRLLLLAAAALVVFTPGHASFMPKLAFVTLLIVATAVSTFRLWNAGFRPRGGLLLSMFFYAAALLVSGLTGLTRSPTAALENGLFYILVLLIVPIAVDAGLGSSRRLLEASLLTTGLLATVSFAVSWLERRGVSSLDTTQLFSHSFLMSALVFQWGLVMTVATPGGWLRRLLAVAASSTAVLAFIVTGTRSVALFSFGFIGYLIWGVRQKKLSKIAVGAAVTAAVAIAIFPWLSSELLTDRSIISFRMNDLFLKLISDPDRDDSWQIRQGANQVAQSALEGHWIFGRGLSMPNPRANLDTSLSTVMRIGIVGTAFLALYLIVLLRWAMKTAPQNEIGSSIRGVISGWFLIIVALTAFTSPVEDRLFAISIGFVIALAVNARQAESPTLNGNSKVKPPPTRRGVGGSTPPRLPQIRT